MVIISKSLIFLGYVELCGLERFLLKFGRNEGGHKVILGGVINNKLRKIYKK